MSTYELVFMIALVAALVLAAILLCACVSRTKSKKKKPAKPASAGTRAPTAAGRPGSGGTSASAARPASGGPAAGAARPASGGKPAAKPIVRTPAAEKKEPPKKPASGPPADHAVSLFLWNAPAANVWTCDYCGAESHYSRGSCDICGRAKT